MKILPWLITFLAIGILYLVVIHYRQANSTLAQENLAQGRKLDDMAGESQRISNALAQADSSRFASNDSLRELLRLRAEVGRLRQENKELVDLREQNRRLRATLATNQAARLGTNSGLSSYWPKESWTFAGYGTPESALQSMLWAANTDDLKNIIASTTPDFRKRMEEDLQKKGETELAAEITEEMAKLNSCHLLDKEVLSDDEIHLTVRMDGDHAETNKMSFLRIANEWKLAKP